MSVLPAHGMFVFILGFQRCSRDARLGAPKCLIFIDFRVSSSLGGFAERILGLCDRDPVQERLGIFGLERWSISGTYHRRSLVLLLL